VNSRAVMPGEFETHEGTLMCWPHRTEIWDGRLAEAEHAYAVTAAAIARFEPVSMVAHPADAARAEAACGEGVTVVEIAIDDSWARDSGPIWVRQGTQTVALDFVFNAWGGKFANHTDDAALAGRIAGQFGHVHRSVPMVLEGGSVSVDGAGNLVTTMQCLLHPNRNPGMSMIDVELALGRELGVDSVVWLPHGLVLDHDTDGHVDNVAAFVAPYHLLLQGCSDPAEDDFARLRVNEQVARAAASDEGSPFRVDSVPVLPFVDTPSGRVVVPYLNFYVGNGFVVVPVCGHPADDEMLGLIGSFFPRREVIGLDVGEILAVGGGGIHCITQQIPAV
jgi:agmatine deiminase